MLGSDRRDWNGAGGCCRCAIRWTRLTSDRDPKEPTVTFAYVADGWTTSGERLDATVLVVLPDGHFRLASPEETAAFYQKNGKGRQ